MRGTVNEKGFIVSLEISTMGGKDISIGKEGVTEFELFKDGNYVEYLEGAFVPKKEGPSICKLGCSFSNLKIEAST